MSYKHVDMRGKRSARGGPFNGPRTHTPRAPRAPILSISLVYKERHVGVGRRPHHGTMTDAPRAVRLLMFS